ncbi:hypothetical protein [Caulobacter sp. LARHSG274]
MAKAWLNGTDLGQHEGGRRYVDRACPVTDVRVYSNAASTELFANSQGFGARPDCPDKIRVWPAMRLRAGDNTVSAQGVLSARTFPVVLTGGDGLRWPSSPRLARPLS